MKIFKTLLLTASFFFMSLVCLNAQYIGDGIELYNSGLRAFQESQFTQAINNVEKALEMAIAIGDDEDALTLKANCEKIIPQLYFSFAKQQINAKDYEVGLQTLAKAIALAEKYADDEVLISAEDIIPQVYTAKGATDVEEGRIAEGIAAYRKALELDKNNSTLYLRIAIAQQRANDEAGALASFDQIIALEGAKPEDLANAQRQAGRIFLTRAVAAQSANKWSEMYEHAKKAAGYDANNTQILKALGRSASELKRWREAVTAYETVMSAEPDARDKNTTIYRLALAYENLNNKAKACSFYRQIVSDANFKAFAEGKVKELCQ